MSAVQIFVVKNVFYFQPNKDVI